MGSFKNITSIKISMLGMKSCLPFISVAIKKQNKKGNIKNVADVTFYVYL